MKDILKKMSVNELVGIIGDVDPEEEYPKKKKIHEAKQEAKKYADNGLTEDLRAWFGKGKKGGAGGGGWDLIIAKGERIGKCGDSKKGEGKKKMKLEIKKPQVLEQKVAKKQ